MDKQSPINTYLLDWDFTGESVFQQRSRVFRLLTASEWKARRLEYKSVFTFEMFFEFFWINLFNFFENNIFILGSGPRSQILAFTMGQKLWQMTDYSTAETIDITSINIFKRFKKWLQERFKMWPKKGWDTFPNHSMIWVCRVTEKNITCLFQL